MPRTTLNLGPSGRGDRPPYPTVVMVKLLLLQQLYNLSDDVLEYPVLDRTSFQRFLGLEHSRRVPDAKTTWVWRERLKKQDLIGDISAAVSGQSVAACRLHRPRRPNHRRQHRQRADPAQLAGGERGDQARPGAQRLERRQAGAKGRGGALDQEARQVVYGYKLHANTDRRWGFIRQHEVAAANVHDSQHFEAILDLGNTHRTILADSAYADRAREAELKQQGYRADIQHKGHATKPLSEAQQLRNHRIAKDRAFGEYPFARLAQQGGKCLRTIGLMRAKGVIGLKVASHGLMRLARLQHRGGVPA